MPMPFSPGAWLAPSSLLRVDSFTAAWPFRRADAALPRLVRGKQILFTAKCHNNPQRQAPILQRLWHSQHAPYIHPYRHLFTYTVLISSTRTRAVFISMLNHASFRSLCRTWFLFYNTSDFYFLFFNQLLFVFCTDFVIFVPWFYKNCVRTAVVYSCWC